MYQRGPKLEVDVRYTNFGLPSDPLPPGYRSRSPLSRGLIGVVQPNSPSQGPNTIPKLVTNQGTLVWFAALLPY